MASHDVLIPFYDLFTLLRCMLNISNEYSWSPGTKSERRTSSCVKDFSSLEEVKRITKNSPSKEGRGSPEGENQGGTVQKIALVLSAVRLIAELLR